jgi:Cys-rich four helix bundle protein (predicted Tat secretion target)
VDRREFLTGSVAVAVVAAAAATARAETKTQAATARDPRLDRIVKSSLDCVATGDACVRHCVEVLGTGDTSLKECLQRVVDLTAVCASLAQVASHASEPTKSLRAYVAACADYCRDCAAACKEHVDHHEVCKACFEACERCIKDCDALTA